MRIVVVNVSTRRPLEREAQRQLGPKQRRPGSGDARGRAQRPQPGGARPGLVLQKQSSGVNTTTTKGYYN